MKRHASVLGDPVEYHPSRQSKFLLTSASEAPCGFFYYSAATENSNCQQMPIASLFFTSQNIHNWITQPCSVEVIARFRGAATHWSDHNSEGQRFAMGTWTTSQYQQPTSAGHSFLYCSHEGSLSDLMSGPSWILAELIGAVPKGQKKRPSSHHVLATCLYVWIPHQDKEQRKSTQSKSGSLGERPCQGYIFSCKE